MRRGRLAATRGEKGGDDGRKEVELTGGVHRPVRERGREWRWVGAAVWAERREVGRARRFGPTVGMGFGVWGLGVVLLFLLFFLFFSNPF
jgi:hypothetical protein